MKYLDTRISLYEHVFADCRLHLHKPFDTEVGFGKRGKKFCSLSGEKKAEIELDWGSFGSCEDDAELSFEVHLLESDFQAVLKSGSLLEDQSFP